MSNTEEEKLNKKPNIYLSINKNPSTISNSKAINRKSQYDSNACIVFLFLNFNISSQVESFSSSSSSVFF